MHQYSLHFVITFTSPLISGVTSFTYFFVQKSSDPLNLAFLLLEKFANTPQDYLKLPREKAEFMAGILEDYKTEQVQGRVLNASIY